MPRATTAAMLTQLEQRLEAERDSLALWLPVALGSGVALWFLLPRPALWAAAALAMLALGLAALALGRGSRVGRAVAIGALAIAAGLALTWIRAERVAAPVLARPAVVAISGRVVRVEPLVARDLVRLTVTPDTPDLPPRIRINLATADVPPGIGSGATIRLRARLMPPPGAAVPGAYDYARVAWFAGIGATGRGFAPLVVTRPAPEGSGLRTHLSAHITAQVAGSAGGVAAALATGDTGAITQADADAMRAAGLAHLLSVSGLHITAVVGATMVIVLRLLALVPGLALRVRLPLVAAAAGAMAAVGYTLLTGAEVPTIRSCVAALLVLIGLALGREAMTLRLVAAGALVVLLLWPEALAGPSFQLSFAAITAIVALHEHPRLRSFGMAREEPWWRRLGRGGVLLLVTGDGRHVAVRTGSGLVLLRDRTGDYMRAMLGETGGATGEPGFLSDTATARCTPDLCLAAIGRWRVLMTRSAYLVPVRELIAACRTADIVVSERQLPRGCHPRWLRLDRPVLQRTGGVAVDFAHGRVTMVRAQGDEHPWRRPPVVMPSRMKDHLPVASGQRTRPSAVGVR